MSKYFTRWVAVDEKLRIGDRFFVHDEKAFGDKTCLITAQNGADTANSAGAVKAKLFLCTKEHLLNHKNFIWGSAIAEISRSATWVKDGDRLNEDQVRFAWWPNEYAAKSLGSDEAMDIEGKYENLLTHGYAEAHGPVYVQVQVIGPCGHFH